MPLTAMQGPVEKRSPAASADSMFWSEPMALIRPIGTITPRNDQMSLGSSRNSSRMSCQQGIGS